MESHFILLLSFYYHDNPSTLISNTYLINSRRDRLSSTNNLQSGVEGKRNKRTGTVLRDERTEFLVSYYSGISDFLYDPGSLGCQGIQVPRQNNRFETDIRSVDRTRWRRQTYTILSSTYERNTYETGHKQTYKLRSNWTNQSKV